MNIKSIVAAACIAATPLQADTPNIDDFVEIIPETEIECLARNIYFESRGEDVEGQEWVAWVTINRKNDYYYPSNICRVVHQCNSNNVCQFSWVRSNRNSTPHEKDAWETALDIAVQVLYEYKINDADDPTNGSIMFHSRSVRPYWRNSYELTGKIGNHLFYR